jgi:hypothetical protein
LVGRGPVNRVVSRTKLPAVERIVEEFLNPDLLKQHLLAGGIYLAAYEMFKSSLVGRPRDFYLSGMENGKEIISPDYKTEVITLDRKYLYRASALWWRKQGVLTDADVELAASIRDHRDEIAHNIPRFLGTSEGIIRLDLLESMFILLSKIDQWWIREIEIPCISDFDKREPTQEDLDGAMSGNMIFLSLIIPIAFGDDSLMRSLYEEWEKRTRQ